MIVGEIHIHGMTQYDEHILFIGLPAVFIGKAPQFYNGVDDTYHIQSPASFLAEEDFGELGKGFRRNQLVMLSYFHFGAVRQRDQKTFIVRHDSFPPSFSDAVFIPFRSLFVFSWL